MIAFVKGKVFQTTHDSVILENHGIGYQIFTPNPMTFKYQEEVMLYTYQHVREDAILLYGFKDQAQYALFLRLIDVKGLGCKSAINMLTVGEVDKIIEAIENSDLAYLKSCPGIGAKTAQQIVLDLKGKLVLKEKETAVVQNCSELQDAHDALLALGYKASEVKAVLKQISTQEVKTADEAIRLALGLLLKRK